MARVDELLISAAVLEKLERKHGVSGWEVEEACLYMPRREQLRREGRGGTVQLLSRTFAGRYLLVILAERGQGAWRVVTARDQTEAERRRHRLYLQQGGG